jgi:hypothetical protein
MLIFIVDGDGLMAVHRDGRGAFWCDGSWQPEGGSRDLAREALERMTCVPVPATAADFCRERGIPVPALRLPSRRQRAEGAPVLRLVATEDPEDAAPLSATARDARLISIA